MNRNRFLLLLLVLLAAGWQIFAQTVINKKKYIGKTFWTKFILATEAAGDGCRIEITPRDFSPSAKSCNFYLHLNADTPVFLKDISEEKGWAKLVFEDKNGGEEFQVFLQNVSKAAFRNSFELAFSDRKISDAEIYVSCNLKTKRDLLKKVGFPSSISRTDGGETWTFDAGWSQFSFCGCDVTYIEIKNNRVTGISGLI